MTKKVDFLVIKEAFLAKKCPFKTVFGPKTKVNLIRIDPGKFIRGKPQFREILQISLQGDSGRTTWTANEALYEVYLSLQMQGWPHCGYPWTIMDPELPLEVHQVKNT